MATNLKEDKVMMGFSIAFIIIVLIVLYSLARTAGELDRILENILKLMMWQYFLSAMQQ